MSTIPWNLIVPAGVEIFREIIRLLGNRDKNHVRRAKVKRFIKRRYPNMKDSLTNFIVEAAIQFLKSPHDNRYIEQFLADLQDFLINWKPRKDGE